MMKQIKILLILLKIISKIKKFKTDTVRFASESLFAR